uniref:Large ribosomal subunit protein bL36m n=1 Tax=Panagrolaimus sp. JU765 TaxID=591449 RepID=A0AC34R314_9BILA
MTFLTRSLTSNTFGKAYALCRGFLVPADVMHAQVSGFKVKSYLKLRCKHCYFVRVNGRLHVECNAHGRHRSREIFDVKKLW